MTVTVLPVRQPRMVHRPYAFLAALQCLDVATTWIVLNYWSVKAEGNPAAAVVLDSLGLHVGLLLLLAFKLAVVALWWDCQTKVRLASAIYSLVILNNFVFLILWRIS